MYNYIKNKKEKIFPQEIKDCTDEINKILKKYKYQVDISEWLVFTNKNGSFSFETDEKGLLKIQ